MASFLNFATRRFISQTARLNSAAAADGGAHQGKCENPFFLSTSNSDYVTFRKKVYFFVYFIDLFYFNPLICY